VCPKCGTQFDPEEAVRNRRIRARTTPQDFEADDEKPIKPVDPDVEGFEDEPDETPEIDEGVEAEPVEADEEEGAEAPVPAPGADIGVDFVEEDVVEDVDDAVPFLEDEDEDFVDEEIEGLPDEEDREG
jgi:uncharacterized protein (TIGR02300 family)